MTDSNNSVIARGLSFEGMEEMESQVKPEITPAQFCSMSRIAIDMGLIRCCAPYWVDEEKKYLVKNNGSGSVFIMSLEAASFYLLGILEARGVDGYSLPLMPIFRVL